jgi:hypothetical protein
LGQKQQTAVIVISRNGKVLGDLFGNDAEISDVDPDPTREF